MVGHVPTDQSVMKPDLLKLLYTPNMVCVLALKSQPKTTPCLYRRVAAAGFFLGGFSGTEAAEEEAAGRLRVLGSFLRVSSSLRAAARLTLSPTAAAGRFIP